MSGEIAGNKITLNKFYDSHSVKVVKHQFARVKLNIICTYVLRNVMDNNLIIREEIYM